MAEPVPITQPQPAAHKAGEATASFEAFFKEHRDRLFGLLCVMTRDRHEADELAQEAFVRLWERWDKVGTIDDPAAYLYRIAVNAFRTTVRRREFLQRLSLRTRPVQVSGPEEQVVLHESLRALTSRQRAAIVLTEVLGYRSDEAARILKIEPSTVRALKYQARAALKEDAEDG